MPIIALSGVRISCDILARNSALTREASSAFSLAWVISRDVVLDQAHADAHGVPVGYGHHQGLDDHFLASAFRNTSSRRSGLPEAIAPRNVASISSSQFSPLRRVDKNRTERLEGQGHILRQAEEFAH